MKRALFTCGKIALGISGILLFVHAAHAADATLYLSPSGGTFDVGSTFTVSVYVDTGGQAVNAVEADLSFPANILQVVSPSVGTSFVKTWVIAPNYSNSDGTLQFAGAIPNPGITTDAGLLSTITFRVTNTGTGVVKFLDSSKVLLNDGLGTNVLGQTADGVYTFVVPPPEGPIVSSPTNPDENKWYAAKSVTLDWSSEASVRGYSYVLDDSPESEPENIVNTTGTSITYSNLADGTYYFHVKALRAGVWGGTTDFEIRVDNTPPAAFPISISPGAHTTSQDPVIQFGTTDAASGMDYYEVKVISLNLPSAAQTVASEATDTPFFIETDSPYVEHLSLGQYQVVVRAYDQAGNYYQAESNLSVVNSFFGMAGTNGLIIGSAVIPWPELVIGIFLLLLMLGYIFKKAQDAHRLSAQHLAAGTMNPEIAAKLAELQQKQKEYEELLKRFTAMVILAAALSFGWGIVGKPATVRAAEAQGAATSLSLDPPIINLYPSSLGNDQVLYVGGWANVPNAQVVLYIEQAETGDTFSGTAAVGADGNWFYSFPQLLDSGHYAAWAELKNGDVTSAPSARVNVTVAPTAIQFGSVRLDYAQFYFWLFILCLAAAIVLSALIIFYARRTRANRFRISASVREAEESLRRGFSVLARDIETELAAVQRLKANGSFSEAERVREEKLRRDLEEVKNYVGREIRKIEE